MRAISESKGIMGRVDILNQNLTQFSIFEWPKAQAKYRAAVIILIFQGVSIVPFFNLLLKKDFFYFNLKYIKSLQNILHLSWVFVVPRFLYHLFFSISDIH